MATHIPSQIHDGKTNDEVNILADDISQDSNNPIESLIAKMEYHIKYSLGKEINEASPLDLYKALAFSVREKLIDQMHTTEQRNKSKQAKRVYYLSMEFLLGRLLENNLHNLGLYDTCKSAIEHFGADFDYVLDSEYDPALGNGGLGRLAACFLDSIATLNIPGYGYGINYEYGLFKQTVRDGFQQEKPDHWMIRGKPWQLERADKACMIPLYGRIESTLDKDGEYNPMWVDWKLLIGVPYDMPVAGYHGNSVNYLRLYSARASDDFDINIFNDGDYVNAVSQKIQSENVSKVLYPSDSMESGKELRLIQEYFFVACAVRDIISQHLENYGTLDNLPEKVAIQLNDTHPALTVAELMRVLVDEHHLDWDHAWQITENTLAYTNHTLLPEALEKWPVSLLEKVLPRHLQLIYEINHRFLAQIADQYPGDGERLESMSIIQEGDERQVRMANLSIVGSHSVNGVAALHSELVKSHLVPNFYNHWPDKFNNKTNGITQRRWLLQANKGLANLITQNIGSDWITNLDQLRELEKLAKQKSFRDDFMAVKHENKALLAKVIYEKARVKVDPSSIFDIQAKRIHEYKRQLLNILHIIHQYLCITQDGQCLIAPRTYIFSGKAAPGYYMAKLYIKLINNLAQIINNDSRVADQIKVAFIPDFKVSVAERIYPAADLSEQISTAGFEASGTGNMKFALNGALTIGTLDGANVEIREEVGDDNIFIFGLSTEEVKLLQAGNYNPWDYYNNNPHIKRVMDTLASDHLCLAGEKGLFRPIFDNLMHHGDFYCHLADMASYIEAQELAASTYKKKATWAKKAILNVARVGKFSSDRTIQQYADEIWGAASTYS